MSNIIKPTFGKKDEPPQETGRLIYVCGNCDCRTFNLFADGSITCSHCDRELCPCEGGEGAQENWRRCVPNPPEDTSTLPTDAGTVNVHYMGDASYARSRTLKNINEWGDKLVMVVGYHDDGSGRSWFDYETEEQRQWVLRKLAEVVKHVEGQQLTKGENEG